MTCAIGRFAWSLALIGSLTLPGSPAVGDSGTIRNSSDATAAVAAHRDSAGAAAKPYETPPMREAMLGHLHNKLIHFPIVLSRRRPCC
jgi:hypothetical protein